MKIAVGASSFTAEDYLVERGYTVVKNPYGRKMTQEEIIAHLDGAVGLLAGLEPLNEAVFQACPNLKAIARIGIGMDNVDVEAAKKYHIKVSNTPDGPTDSVSETTLAALLAMEHRLFEANQDVHNGVWKKRLGRSITELTVFIIGYGRIGKKVGELLSANGAKILIYDKFSPEHNSCTLEEGLQLADVVTLHASGTDEILGNNELSLMKPEAILLNGARGNLVNQDALYQALKRGQLGGFWGDALWEEPYNGQLCQLSNAVLTPHICTYTTKCRQSMEMQAIQNLLEDLYEI